MKQAIPADYLSSHLSGKSPSFIHPFAGLCGSSLGVFYIGQARAAHHCSHVGRVHHLGMSHGEEFGPGGLFGCQVRGQSVRPIPAFQSVVYIPHLGAWHALFHCSSLAAGVDAKANTLGGQISFELSHSIGELLSESPSRLFDSSPTRHQLHFLHPLLFRRCLCVLEPFLSSSSNGSLLRDRYSCTISLYPHSTPSQWTWYQLQPCNTSTHCRRREVISTLPAPRKSSQRCRHREVISTLLAPRSYLNIVGAERSSHYTSPPPSGCLNIHR